MTEFVVQFHPDFFKDLDNLDKKGVEIFYKKLLKIKQNPFRLKHLSGGTPCYREEITSNIRLIYAVEGNTLSFLTIGRHNESYKTYLKRLHNLRQNHALDTTKDNKNQAKLLPLEKKTK